jgi:bifunctional DNA-binding transcriptional regulator/antitoxin component of YhaV-PrlF toxin-antitoxin module
LALELGDVSDMYAHIDKAGRLILPRAVRQQLGITPCATLELVPGPDGVLLRKVTDSPTMRQVDGLWIHQGVAPATADWSRIVDNLRSERDTTAWNT